MNPTRRRFIEVIPLAGAASWLVACSDKAPAPAPMVAPAPAPLADAAPASPAAPATTATLVDEKEPAAVALGYVAVASRADTTRFKNYAAGQACSNCALYGGKPGDATGPCPLFAGRLVAGPGWCSGYVKKTT
jgi:hypothetical protein